MLGDISVKTGQKSIGAAFFICARLHGVTAASFPRIDVLLGGEKLRGEVAISGIRK